MSTPATATAGKASAPAWAATTAGPRTSGASRSCSQRRGDSAYHDRFVEGAIKGPLVEKVRRRCHRRRRRTHCLLGPEGAPSCSRARRAPPPGLARHLNRRAATLPPRCLRHGCRGAFGSWFAWVPGRAATGIADPPLRPEVGGERSYRRRRSRRSRALATRTSPTPQDLGNRERDRAARPRRKPAIFLKRASLPPARLPNRAAFRLAETDDSAAGAHRATDRLREPRCGSTSSTSHRDEQGISSTPR